MSDKKTQSLERVIETAAQMFAQRRFEDVSVNDVALAARCSTATIYEVYETKENLFLHALNFYVHRWRPPRPTPEENSSPFLTLMSYAEARIRFLAHPTTRSLTRALGERYDKTHRFLRPTIEDMATFDSALDLIVTCMDTDLMRRGDAEATTYSIIAGISFEPIASGVMFGVDAPVDVGQILRKAFLPHVTEKGGDLLQAYLQRDNLGPTRSGDYLPLSQEHS